MIGDGKRGASAQSHEWSSLCKDGEAAKTADERKGGERLQTAMEGSWTVPDFCCSFAELAVQLSKIDGRHEGQTLKGVVFSASSNAKELRRQFKRVENCECVGTADAQDALRRDRFQKEKLERVGESPVANAVL